MFTDDDRRAAILMAHVPPAGWGELATKADLAQLSAELRGEMAELRGEMAELRGELRGEMRAQLPKLIAANIGSIVAAVGLALAAIR